MTIDKTEKEFFNFLLNMGPGYSVNYLDETFPDQNECGDKNNLLKGTVYTPLNKHIRAINDMCLSMFPGEERVYLLADSVLENNHKDTLPVKLQSCCLGTCKQVLTGITKMAPGWW